MLQLQKNLPRAYGRAIHRERRAMLGQIMADRLAKCGHGDGWLPHDGAI